MLESLFNFKEIRKRPYLGFLWAFAIISLSVIIAMQVGFKISVGTVTVNLTGVFTLAFALISSSYIMTAIIRKEELMEEKAIRAHYNKGFWERHKNRVSWWHRSQRDPADFLTCASFLNTV